MTELSKQESFDTSKSPLKEAYRLLDVKTPRELQESYEIKDKKLMKSGIWDYYDQNLITNKIKKILENVDENELTSEEEDVVHKILWLWYQEAINCAIWKYRNREKAKECAEKALNYQKGKYPNKITRLLYFLVNDKLEEAEEWEKIIEAEDGKERKMANHLVSEYKKHNFFLKQNIEK
jgi:hypothetical protein